MRFNSEMMRFKRHPIHILSLITVSPCLKCVQICVMITMTHCIRNDELCLVDDVFSFANWMAVTEGIHVNVGLSDVKKTYSAQIRKKNVIS